MVLHWQAVENSGLIVENTLAQYRPITTAYKTILHILYTVDKAYEAKRSYIINQTVKLVWHICICSRSICCYTCLGNSYIYVTRAYRNCGLVFITRRLLCSLMQVCSCPCLDYKYIINTSARFTARKHGYTHFHSTEVLES